MKVTGSGFDIEYEIYENIKPDASKVNFKLILYRKKQKGISTNPPKMKKPFQAILLQ